ncbi:OLC1v1027200C1 [Oldenlandia corymbosa var. corymbosa]|uniref:OLC1v1027200C1 n=1 Tax=Oldenlandia corymbosa var. corymbosa TaxID=529605 RepID=A0AAV1CBX8_OLDCO|nr:OLC1v1027200C1 [Oldenlandia corymbosa var. corymbosa]
MKKPNNISFQFACFLLCAILWAASADPQYQNFINCFVNNSSNSAVISTPDTSSYSSILNVSIQNLRFTLPNTPKPQLILTPQNEAHIQTALYCSQKHKLQVRILSGGHDFEGSSYVSNVSFFVLNMYNFRSISVDSINKTAWVGAGATLGETYYNIVQANSSLAFPAGYYPQVGIGGHISGGGYGCLVRKFGLAADNVLDARVIDAEGRILNRASMGEDLFWAIRGGTGASFAVILEYKVKLVEIPKEQLTAFSLKRTLEQNATDLVHKWQTVGPNLPPELLLELQLTVVPSNQTADGKTIQATFVSLFLGGADDLVSIMNQNFPELGLVRDDCITLSRWVDFITYFYQRPLNLTDTILTSRVSLNPKSYFKSTSEFVQNPIPKQGLEQLWDVMRNISSPPVLMNWTPFGARMAEIPESEIPFPHRAGNIYMVFKKIQWQGTDPDLIQERFASARRLTSFFGSM